MYNILLNYFISEMLFDYLEVMLKFVLILYLFFEIYVILYYVWLKNVFKFWVYYSCGVIFSFYFVCRCEMVNCIGVVFYFINLIFV